MSEDFWGELQERDMKDVIRQLKPESKERRMPMLMYEMRMRKKRAEQKGKKKQRESEFIQRQARIAYDDVLLERNNNKRIHIEKRKQARWHRDRMYKARMASNTVMKKDTSYPRFLERATPERMEDAYSGPTDPVEWGPRGHTFYWNKYRADIEALPMSSLVKGPM